MELAKILGVISGTVIGYCVYFSLLALPVWFIWNHTVVNLFQVREVTWADCVSLLVLANCAWSGMVKTNPNANTNK